MARKIWGSTADNKPIYTYTIQNEHGLLAKCMDYGATLLSLYVPDKDGICADVVLGYEHHKDYFVNDPCYGCSILRNANRVANAQFFLHGKTYTLDKNDGKNNLHSGFLPLHKRLWDVSHYEKDSITFSYHSPHMDMGFPGNADITVTYTVTDKQQLQIVYTCISDEETVFNPTNHSYFNLLGHDSSLVLDEMVTIDADSFTYANEHSICDGQIRPVEDTPMDFRTEKFLGADILSHYDQLIYGRGYDHNYILNHKEDEIGYAASLFDPTSRRKMNVYTDMPGLQLYTGNYIDPAEVGKGGCHYMPRQGVCFETQFFPNALNVPTFKQPVIPANKLISHTTIFEFENVE